MRRILITRERERGAALVTIVVLGALTTLLAVTLIGTITDEGKRSVSSTHRSVAFQAAEAGLDDYIAKMTEDRQYYLRNVHPAESTRRAPTGATVSAGNPWTLGASWSYPTPKSRWRSLRNGYEYNLQVTPPGAGIAGVRILATGRRAGSTSEWRAIEALVRPTSVADFQMLANADIAYGSSASTYGRIYAGIDDTGDQKNVTHGGTAYADVMAEGRVLGSPTLRNGAKVYDSATTPGIRTVIKTPVNFNSFLFSLVDIQSAAQTSGLYLNDPTVNAWWLTFRSDGRIDVRRCSSNGGQPIAAATPICGSPATYTVPANGAVYAAQTVVASGQVNGRVTVASNMDVVIGDNISYVDTSDDVLGLIARNEMIVAQYTPSTLSWRAATLVQSGLWRSWSSGGSHASMTFSGATATNQGGYMTQFRSRVYNYDTTLLSIPPPWFPVIENAWTILMFRELRP